MLIPFKTFAAILILPGLASCVSAVKTDPAGKADFKQKATQITAQINACRATSEGVTAMKSPTIGNSLHKHSATIGYSNASITDAGVLKVSSSNEGTVNMTNYSQGFTSQQRTITTETVRIPLAEVDGIHLSNWGTSQTLGVSNSGTATHAGLTTQARFQVFVTTDGEAVSQHSISRTTDSFGGKPTKFVDSGKKGSAPSARFRRERRRCSLPGSCMI